MSGRGAARAATPGPSAAPRGPGARPWPRGERVTGMGDLCEISPTFTQGAQSASKQKLKSGCVIANAQLN